jgi:hypothetical protein
MGAAIGDILGLAAGVAVSPRRSWPDPDAGHPAGPANGSLFGIGWPAWPAGRPPWPCSSRLAPRVFLLR